MATIRARARFIGRVQGVLFRESTRRQAARLGVVGWVRNLDDGSVEAVFEGERAKVEELVQWCARSQPHARVDRLEMTEESPTGEFSTFEVRG